MVQPSIERKFLRLVRRKVCEKVPAWLQPGNLLHELHLLFARQMYDTLKSRVSIECGVGKVESQHVAFNECRSIFETGQIFARGLYLYIG
jgi:hypothetical protein